MTAATTAGTATTPHAPSTLFFNADKTPRQRLPVLRTTQAVTMCSKQFEATMSAACNRLTRGLIPIAVR